MGRIAAGFAIVVLGAAGGVAGAAGYDHFNGRDSTASGAVKQAPIGMSASEAAAGEQASTTLTPAQIYARAAPGVVLIQAAITETTKDALGQPTQQKGTATGTGFVVTPSGFIVTNAHVVVGAKTVVVQFGANKTVPGTVVGTDVNNDLAVIKVDPSEVKLFPLRLGTAKVVHVGDPVAAIGNPFGLDRTLTTGVVSALQRRIQGLNSYFIDNVIQTDAAINKGNSGGPLLDGHGRVIGVNSQIQSDSGGNVGIGFAVPVDTVKRQLPQLEKGETVRVAYLGIEALPAPPQITKLGMSKPHGLVVIKVSAGTGAAKSGLKAGGPKGVVVTEGGIPINISGDVILAVDGHAMMTTAQLQSYIATKNVGDQVAIELWNSGKRRTVNVTLGDRPTTLATN